MATIRLVPGAYTLSNTTYLTISNADNMYTNTDSTTYGTCTHTRASTSYTYYLYLHNFNFNSVPSDAEIDSFTIKIKANATGQSTSSSYRMSLYNNTTSISSTTVTSSLSTTVTTFTFPNGNLTWSTLKNYANNFRIRIPLRRSSSNTSSIVNVYGAEIEVTYTVPEPRTITSTLSGNGTISPNGATTSYDGEEYTLTITPTNIVDTITVTNNGNDVTSELEAHYSGGTATSYSTASGTGVTTGFARSGGAFYQSSSTSSDSWLRYAIGHTAESPYSTSNTSNTYCKDGTNDATTQGWMNYPFDFSGLPNDAEVTSVEVKCYGATESTTETARHADVSLWCGNEQKGTTQSFTSTSNSTITLNDPGDWTREELQDAWVRFGVGYYGGRILGITWKVNYTYGGTLHHYTYTYDVNGDATIAVTIGSSAPVSVTGVNVTPSTASVETGSTIQLTATISPSNATNQAVTWSSNNTAAATVNSSGLVTVVAAGQGTATITATTVDGGYTATCVITIVTVPTTEYVLTSTLIPGKTYLIANGNNGSVYLMSSESGGSRQLKGVAATVSNNKINLKTTDESQCAFECILYTTGNDITTTLVNDNKYLYSDSSTGLRFQSTDSLNRFWHYEDGKFWLFKSTSTNGYTDTSSEYKYYLEWDNNGNFTDNHVTSPSISDTTLPNIYLFIPASSATEAIYFKNNGAWTAATKVYKKINGSWVEQTDLTSVFSSTINYIKG